MRDNKISRTGEPASPSPHILVAEDEPLLRKLNTQALIGSGYQADAAEDGATAWQALNTGSYDLLITDHDMPNLTGVQLIRKLHDSHMHLPVIMATGTLPQEELTRSPWLKPAAILIKPYTIAELLGTVKEILLEDESVGAPQPTKLSNMNDTAIPQTEQPADITPPRPAHSPPARILVVDDNSDTRQLSVDILVGSGYDVEAVMDGAAGWEAVQSSDYDLVLTDNKMPRMTGIEMIEKLRSAYMTPSVIMATRHLPVQEFARKPWLKPDASLQRPFTNDELLAAVKKVLHTDGGNDGHTGTLLPKYL